MVLDRPHSWNPRSIWLNQRASTVSTKYTAKILRRAPKMSNNDHIAGNPSEHRIWFETLSPPFPNEKQIQVNLF